MVVRRQTTNKNQALAIFNSNNPIRRIETTLFTTLGHTSYIPRINYLGVAHHINIEIALFWAHIRRFMVLR